MENIIEKLQQAKENSSFCKLKMLFDLQGMFDNYLKEKRNLDYSDKESWIKQMCLCIISEACELIDETNWKHWKNKKPIDENKIKEEIIDLWHFLISLSIKAGLTPDDIKTIYIDKNLENYKRQLGISERTGYQI